MWICCPVSRRQASTFGNFLQAIPKSCTGLFLYFLTIFLTNCISLTYLQAVIFFFQFYNLVQISLSGSFNEENTFFRFNGLGEDSTSFVSKLVRVSASKDESFGLAYLTIRVVNFQPEKTFWYILAPICSGEESTKVLSAFNKIVNWDVDCSFLVIDDVIHNQFVTGCPKPEGLRPYGPGEVYYMPMEVAFGLGTRYIWKQKGLQSLFKDYNLPVTF